MDITKLLEERHSKQTTELIAKYLIQNPNSISTLINLIDTANIAIKQRASWPISVIAQKKPNLLLPYLEELVSKIEESENHPAVNRNIVRGFQYMKIPEEFEGRILNRCFEFISDHNQPVAVKAFSMTVVHNLSKKYPEICGELKTVIESILPNGSAGIKSRGNKILKALNKT